MLWLKRIAVSILVALWALATAGPASAQRVSGAADPRELSAEGVERRVLERDGRPREFYLYRPVAAAGRAAPLVFVIHGGGGRALQMRRAGFEALADREGFVVVYPQGWNNGWADGRLGERIVRRAEGADDPAFFKAMLDGLVAEGIADPSRIYATGPSNGGFMSFRIGCELPVAAIAPVIGAMGVDFSAACKPQRPIGVLMINGTQDRLVPYGGGAVAGNASGGIGHAVDDTIAQWLGHNRCAATKTETTLPDRARDDETTTTLFVWDQCAPGGEVRLMRVNGGGHAWHGPVEPPTAARIARTGPVSRDFNGAEEIWGFLKRFARTP